jgi:hypothetical protein
MCLNIGVKVEVTNCPQGAENCHGIFHSICTTAHLSHGITLFCSCITRDGHQIAHVKTGKAVLVVHLTRMVDQVAAVLGT